MNFIELNLNSYYERKFLIRKENISYIYQSIYKDKDRVSINTYVIFKDFNLSESKEKEENRHVFNTYDQKEICVKESYDIIKKLLEE